jgi:hypothetical protein
MQLALADYPEVYNLSGVQDKTHQVTSLIKAEIGGTLETTDTDGNYYKLIIPKNALSRDLEISLIPLKITGLVGETKHIGVDISPAGTKLFPFANLIIHPKDFDMKNAYWFETTGNVRRIKATPAFSYDGAEGVLLTHFSGGTIASGTSMTSASLNGGVSDNSASWYKWQQSIVEQDFKNGKIDSTTRDAKMNIINERLAELAQQKISNLIEDTKIELDKAIDRLKNSANDPDLKMTKDFLDRVRDVFILARQLELFGVHHLDLSVVQKYFDKYAGAIYKNCAKESYDSDTIRGLERLRILTGGEEETFDLTPCLFKTRKFLLTGEYISKKLVKEESPSIDLDNILDRFSVQFEVSHSIKEASPLYIAVLNTEDKQATYDLKYESTYIEGEGCEITQSPVGVLDVFSLSLNDIKMAGFFIPELNYPDNFPLPPNTPRHKDAFAQLDIELKGLSTNIGWIFKSDHPSCKEPDIAPSSDSKNFHFRIDPTKYLSVGAKTVEDHVKKTASLIEGWTFTIERQE